MPLKVLQDNIIKQFKMFPRYIKDNIFSILCSFLVGIGEGYMNDSIIAGILLSIGLMGIIYLFGIGINAIKVILNEQNDIKDKIFIKDIVPHLLLSDNTWYIGFAISIANCSNQIVEVIFDAERTKVIVNNNTISDTKYPTISLLPYACTPHNVVRTHCIEYEKIKNDKTIDIRLNIAFKYSKNEEQYIALHGYKGKCIIKQNEDTSLTLSIIDFDLQNRLL